MLTAGERQWLNDREIILAGLGHYIWDSYYWDEDLPHEDMKEAAEFEARVAAKLAKYAAMQQAAFDCLDCPCAKAGICYEGIKMYCREILLKLARITVEEEMDNGH